MPRGFGRGYGRGMAAMGYAPYGYGQYGYRSYGLLDRFRGWLYGYGRGFGRGRGIGASLGYCPYTGMPRGGRWYGYGTAYSPGAPGIWPYGTTQKGGGQQ